MLTDAHVQFLGLCKDPAQEPSLQTRTGHHVCDGERWQGICRGRSRYLEKIGWMSVKSRYQAGDMVVCFAEQRAGLSHKPLSQILQSDLNVPLYILSGSLSSERFAFKLAVHRLPHGRVPLPLSSASSVLQVKIDQSRKRLGSYRIAVAFHPR